MIDFSDISVPVLPDGSSFFTGSFPLPDDHWLYAPPCESWDEARDCVADRPIPFLTHNDRQKIINAVQYAIRAATNRGQIQDFDPDALVQNAVVAICGNYNTSCNVANLA